MHLGARRVIAFMEILQGRALVFCCAGFVGRFRWFVVSSSWGIVYSVYALLLMICTIGEER